MTKRSEELQTPVRRDDDLLTAVDLALQYGITLQRARGLFDKCVIPTTPSGPRRRVTTRRAFLDWRGRTLGIREHDQAEHAAPPADRAGAFTIGGDRTCPSGKSFGARVAAPPVSVPHEGGGQRSGPEDETSNGDEKPVFPVRADDDLLSCRDLIQQYNLPRDFARKLIHGGIIKSIPVGARKRVTTRREFRKWIESSLSYPAELTSNNQSPIHSARRRRS